MCINMDVNGKKLCYKQNVLPSKQLMRTISALIGITCFDL